MTEKFIESINKGNAFGALLTDLSKAFDCIDPTLLIPKFCIQGFTLTIKISILLLIESNAASQNQQKF